MVAGPTPATSFSDSLQRLRGAQKSSKGAPLYSLLVNRPLGRIFAAFFHQLGWSPNQVTAVSAVFTFVGIALIAVLPPSVASALLITVALVLGYALDAADGQLARLRGGGSLAGEWLDHVIDSFKIATIHLAVLVLAYRFLEPPGWWLAVPLVFAAAYVVHFFGFLLTDLLTRVHSPGAPKATGGSSVMALLKLPTDYGVLCLSFLLLSWPPAFLVVYALLALAMLGYTLLVLPKWYKSIKNLD